MTVKPAAGLRSWLRPGLLGLHVFAVAAVAFCVVMGLWQLGIYDSRQADERADQQVVPTVALSEVWGPDEPFEARLNQRPVTARAGSPPTPTSSGSPTACRVAPAAPGWSRRC